MSETGQESARSAVDARLAEIEARANAATAGPWGFGFNANGWEDGDASICGWMTGEIATLTACVEYLYHDRKNMAVPRTLEHQRANGEFMSHAREDIPWLIAQLRRSPGEKP